MISKLPPIIIYVFSVDLLCARYPQPRDMEKGALEGSPRPTPSMVQGTARDTPERCPPTYWHRAAFTSWGIDALRAASADYSSIAGLLRHLLCKFLIAYGIKAKALTYLHTHTHTVKFIQTSAGTPTAFPHLPHCSCSSLAVLLISAYNSWFPPARGGLSLLGRSTALCLTLLWS